MKTKITVVIATAVYLIAVFIHSFIKLLKNF